MAGAIKQEICEKEKLLNYVCGKKKFIHKRVQVTRDDCIVNVLQQRSSYCYWYFLDGHWGLIQKNRMSWSPTDALVLCFLHHKLPQRSLPSRSGPQFSNSKRVFKLSKSCIKHHTNLCELATEEQKICCSLILRLVLSQACQKSCSTTALLCSPHSLSALITGANSPPRCTAELAGFWGVGPCQWR